MKLIDNCIRYIRTGHWKPLYVKDVIHQVIYKNGTYKIGLCHLVSRAMWRNDIPINKLSDIQYYIPKFTVTNAVLFGGRVDESYWWPCSSNYDSKRYAFLKWIYDQYENDTTDLRILYLQKKEKSRT